MEINELSLTAISHIRVEQAIEIVLKDRQMKLILFFFELECSGEVDE